MNNKFKIIPLVALSLGMVASVSLGTVHGIFATQPSLHTYKVSFFKNFAREEFFLSNGTKAKGNNLLFKTVEAEEYKLLAMPDENPVRKYYDFAGWYKETSCENAWDFNNDRITGDLRLYAKWTYSTAQEEQEPSYTPPSTVLAQSAATNYELYSVMNFEIKDDQVKLPRAALMKLEANKDNVLSLIEYKAKKDLAVSASYANNAITFKCGNETKSITVKDVSNDLILDNATYETKAKNYEAKALEEDSYHVMLAGSSSIEFWTSSKEDLNPVISYNHGIGGTTIEEWTNSLNPRLVYPYKPKMVVYYVGINNVINSKQNSSTIWNHLKTFFDETHKALPNTKVQYILMNLIPGFKEYFTTIEEVNAQAVNYQKTNTWLTLINPGEALLKANGDPNAAYFRVDGLHLSYYGYVIWGGIIKESIYQGLENN